MKAITYVVAVTVLVIWAMFLTSCAPVGADGATGPKGQTGRPGFNGHSCTVMQLEDGAVINCPDGSSAVISNGHAHKHTHNHPNDND